MTDKLNTHQTAYNEFIMDFVERHGNNRATRDEAHEWADRIVSMARDALALCLKYSDDRSIGHDAAHDLSVALCGGIQGLSLGGFYYAIDFAGAVIDSEFSA